MSRSSRLFPDRQLPRLYRTDDCADQRGDPRGFRLLRSAMTRRTTGTLEPINGNVGDSGEGRAILPATLLGKPVRLLGVRVAEIGIP